MSNFDSDPFTCDLALFPAKTIPNNTKSNCIFLGEEKGDRALILRYLDSRSAEDFLCTIYFSRYWPSSWGNGESKLDQKCKLWSPSLFCERSNTSNFSELPLMKISAKLDHIWGMEGSKTSQKGPVHGY